MESTITNKARITILIGSLYAAMVAVIAFNSDSRLFLGPFYLPAVFVYGWYTRPRLGVWLVLYTAVLWFYAHPHFGIKTEIKIFNFMSGFSAGLGVYFITSAWHKHQSHSGTDHLTGVANHRGLDRYAKREIERCRRQQQPMSVGYMDCDDFKLINDRFGHKMGDSVLKIIGKTLTENVRPTDLIARVGGDEFVVILSGTGWTEAAVVMEALKGHVEEAAREAGIDVTVSAGLVTFDVVPLRLEEMLKQADAEMYKAKSARKTRSTRGSPEHAG